MKTVEELYKEIAASKKLQEELKNASKEMLEAFLKKHGCDADADEFIKLSGQQTESVIDDEAAAAIAGGGGVYHRPAVLEKTQPLP